MTILRLLWSRCFLQTNQLEMRTRSNSTQWKGGKRTRQKQTEARSICEAYGKVLLDVRVEMNSLNPKKT